MRNSGVMLQLNEVNLSIFKSIAARYKSLGLDITPVQSRIVMFLFDKEEEICQRDIEKFVSCNKSTMSALLNTMEKNGLIIRVGSDIDSRRKIIKLTAKSSSIANILRNDKEKIDEILSSNISKEEYEALSLILNKIKKNIERI